VRSSAPGKLFLKTRGLFPERKTKKAAGGQLRSKGTKRKTSGIRCLLEFCLERRSRDREGKSKRVHGKEKGNVEDTPNKGTAANCSLPVIRSSQHPGKVGKKSESEATVAGKRERKLFGAIGLSPSRIADCARQKRP